MSMYSKYFGKEIELSAIESVSNGEVVLVVPHDDLVDVIINSQDAIDNNIQAHTAPIVVEPGHYAFLCTISDKNGRRVEEIGESTIDTLETVIARGYPALMAFKRSFDAAAIRFLGLPGKLYSDQQISSVSSDTVSTGNTYVAPPVEEDANFGKSDEPESSTENEEAVPAQKEEKPADKKKTSGRRTARKSTYAAPPLEEGEPESKDEPAEAPNPEEPSKQPAEPKETAYTAPPIDEEMEPVEQEEPPKATSYAAPPIEEDVPVTSEPAPDASDTGDKDIFDTTIIECGMLKGMKISIRKGYEVNPSAVRWIAEMLTPRSEVQAEQQKLCRQFLESIKEGA